MQEQVVMEVARNTRPEDLEGKPGLKKTVSLNRLHPRLWASL